MRIAFVGDVHGRVFHLLAALVEAVKQYGPFDAIIQLGDLGVFRGASALDDATRRFAADDETELGFVRLLGASGELAELLHEARRAIGVPVHFIRGNHEDFDFLDERLGAGSTAPVDPFGLFVVVRDGTVLDLGGVRVGFLGGADYDGGSRPIDPAACEALRTQSVDVLVTHDGPYGCGQGFLGTQGSTNVTALLRALHPAHHIYGHYHHVNRPDGHPNSIGLSILLLPPRHDPSGRIQPGSIAVLDWDADELQTIDDDWLAAIRPLDAVEP